MIEAKFCCATKTNFKMPKNEVFFCEGKFKKMGKEVESNVVNDLSQFAHTVL